MADLPDSEGDAMQALEALIIGNPEFDQLKLLLAEFNLFEAVGMVRQEIRHSMFLAFLLDPAQNHGLGDALVTRLLQAILLAARGAPLPVSPLDLDVWSLDEITVQREWQHIDILLLHEEHRLAVAIENKVDSIEHSDQLARYHQIVRRAHPDKKFFGIYLTPDGEPPSHPEYLSCSYALVAKTIQDLVESQKSTLGEDTRTVLRHYHQMLHRHIMSESEIAELCQRIYRKHQRALDLIFEHRPDVQSELSGHLRHLIAHTRGIHPVGGGKAMIRFTAEQWNGLTELESASAPTGRLIYFEFYNGPNELSLGVYMGPGPLEKREAILKLALRGSAVRPASRKLGKDWKTLKKWKFLKPGDYESASPSELMDLVNNRWSSWTEAKLPEILEELSPERLRDALNPPAPPDA